MEEPNHEALKNQVSSFLQREFLTNRMLSIEITYHYLKLALNKKFENTILLKKWFMNKNVLASIFQQLATAKN